MLWASGTSVWRGAVPRLVGTSSSSCSRKSFCTPGRYSGARRLAAFSGDAKLEQEDAREGVGLELSVQGVDRPLLAYEERFWALVGST